MGVFDAFWNGISRGEKRVYGFVERERERKGIEGGWHSLAVCVSSCVSFAVVGESE